MKITNLFFCTASILVLKLPQMEVLLDVVDTRSQPAFYLSMKFLSSFQF